MQVKLIDYPTGNYHRHMDMSVCLYIILAVQKERIQAQWAFGNFIFRLQVFGLKYIILDWNTSRLKQLLDNDEPPTLLLSKLIWRLKEVLTKQWMASMEYPRCFSCYSSTGSQHSRDIVWSYHKRHNQCDELWCKCSNHSQRIGLTSSCSLTQCRFSAIKASPLN